MIGVRPRIALLGSGQWSCSVPFHLNFLVDEFPERKFDKASKSWRMPPSRMNKSYLRQNASLYDVDPAIDLLEPLICDVSRTIRSIPVGHEFRSAPLDHQRSGLEKALASDLDGHAFFFEQGLGKTYTSIHLACMLYEARFIDAVLLLHRVSVRGWPSQLDEHSPLDWQPYPIVAGGKSKPIPSNGPVWGSVGIESVGVSKAIFGRAMEFVEGRRTMLILDESSNIKNPKPTRTKNILELAALGVYRVILTGTKVTEGYENLYTQMFFVDPGIIGLSSFYTFRNRYVRLGGYENKKIVGYSRIPELISKIEPYVSQALKIDVRGLPAKTHETRVVPMGTRQEAAHRLMDRKKTGATPATGTVVEAESALTAYTYCHQIAGGFLKGEPYLKNPKLEELDDMLDEIARPFLVWTRARAELAAVVQLLRRRGLRTAEFHGGVPPEDRTALEKDFQLGEYDAMVLTYAGAYGLNLFRAATAVYYSKTWSHEQIAQSEDRIHRIGSDSTARLYIHLEAEGSVDMDVVEALQRKESMSAYVSRKLRELGSI